MRHCRAWVKMALCALAMVVGGAGLLAAQEVSLSNLALKNTYLKTRSDSFELSVTSWTSIFSSTAITCPGTSGTCTARIEVSMRFEPGAGFDRYVKCRVIRSGGSFRRLSLSRVTSYLLSAVVSRSHSSSRGAVGHQCYRGPVLE